MRLIQFPTKNALRPYVWIAPGWVKCVQAMTRNRTRISLAGQVLIVAEPVESVVNKLREYRP